MPSTKTLQQIAQKWATRAAAAQGDYHTGITSTPAGKWETNAAAAESSWEQGVAQATAAHRFQRGVQGRGQKWLTRASSVGPNRYAQGVSQGQPDFSSGFSPYFNTIQSTDLGPRGPRGDMRNYSRSQKLGDALHAARVSGAGT